MAIRYFKIYLCFVLCFIFTSDLLSDDIKVLFKKSPRKLYTMKSFSKGNEVYVSAGDFAKLLSLNPSSTESNNRFEIVFPRGSLRIESMSPFIKVHDKLNGKTTVQQMNSLSLRHEDEIYVPIDDLLKHCFKITGSTFEFNPKTNTLVLPANYAPPISRNSSAGSSLVVSKKANGYTIKIPLKEKYKITHQYYRKENLLLIKFMTGDINLKYAENNSGNEIIEKVLFKNHPSTSELKLFLSQEIESSDVFYSERNKELYILLFKKFNVDSLFNTERRRKTIENNLEKKRKKWELNNIIIDPGHGGKDPGCIGITKKYEKNIVLNIALKLGKLIEKKTDIKVHYTRKNDTFIPIYKRGQIANEKKGNLFISIHCNSNPTRNQKIQGFEAYILRPGRTEEAIAVAELENSVIKYEDGYKERYKHLSDENFILTAMAQNAYVKFSENFAEKLCDNVEKKLPLKNKGVLQAGFYVLVGASMPSVLLECGYLSNKQDEAFLNSPKGQQKMAESIFHSILTYKEEYEKSLKEGQ